MKSCEEVALRADEDAVLLVDPDGADEIAEDLFELVVGFGVGIAGVVEDDGGAAVEVDAARVGEGAELEDAGDGEEVVAAGVGGFAFGGSLLRDALWPWRLLCRSCRFLLDFFGGEGFAVAGDDAVDADAVDGEAFGVGGRRSS